MMKIFNWIIIFSAFTFSGYSQTIINAERLTDGVDSSIISLSIAYSGARGNSSIDQIDISPAYILLKKNNAYNLFGGYNFLSNDGEGILNSGFVHFRHNYNIADRLKTYEFYQLQFNDVLILKKRQVFGGGLRYSYVMKDSLKLDFELGLMRDMENFNEETLLPGEAKISYNTRISFVNSFKYIISDYIKLNNVIYYQPAISDFSNFRILNDFSMTVAVSKYFNLITALTIRYNNYPPGSLEKLDSSLNFGINLKL